MAITVTIAGTDRSSLVASFSRTRRLNQIGDATLQIVDRAGAYTPSVFDLVSVSVGAVLVFTGTIMSVRCSWIAPYTGRQTIVRCVDRNHAATRTIRNGIEAAGQTLKQVLEGLVDENLSVLGVTLDAAQVDGPTFTTALTFPWVRVQEALDYLSLQTGYIWSIDYNNVLSMWEIGTRAAPLTFSEANGNINFAEWEQTLGDYANGAWITYGPSGPVDQTDTFTGDGATREFVLSYYVTSTATVPQPMSYVTVTRSGSATAEPVGDGLEWSFAMINATTGKIVHTGGTVLAATDTVSATYTAQMPHDTWATNSLEIAAHDDWWIHITDYSITSLAEAQAMVDSTLRRMVTRPQRLTLDTLTSGNDPGEVVTVTLTELGVSGEFLIDEEQFTYRKTQAGDLEMYRLSLTGGTEKAPDWVSWWKWLKSGLFNVSNTPGGGVSGGLVLPFDCETAETVWTQNFEAGLPDTGHWGSTAWWTGVPGDDTVYPNLMRTDDIVMTNGIGRGGGYAVAPYPDLSAMGDIVFGNIGSDVEGNAIDARGGASVTVWWYWPDDDAVWPSGMYSILLNLFYNGASFNGSSWAWVAISHYSGAYRWELHMDRGYSGHTEVDVSTATFTRASMAGAWHKIQLCFKPATFNWDAGTQNDDGWVQLRVDDTLIYDYQNSAVMMLADTEIRSNTLRYLGLGYYDFTGYADDITVRRRLGPLQTLAAESLVLTDAGTGSIP